MSGMRTPLVGVEPAGRLAALKSEHDELLAKVGDLACEMRVLLPTAMKDARGELLDMLRWVLAVACLACRDATRRATHVPVPDG